MASQKQLEALARGRATRAANKQRAAQQTAIVVRSVPTYPTRVIPPDYSLPERGYAQAAPERSPRKQSASAKVKRSVRKGARSLRSAFKTKGGTAIIVASVAALAAGAVLTGEGVVKDTYAAAGFSILGIGALALGAPKVGVAMLAIGVFEGVQAGVSAADSYRGRLLAASGTAGAPADAAT